MTTDLSGKTYWLVGASEGLGRALAERLSAEGVRLCLSARSRDRLEALAADLPGMAEVAVCDVREPESVASAFQSLPPLDGLIYNAGAYKPIRAQDWDADTVEAMFDVNLMGAVRVLGHVVPAMVARGSGHVALVGSLAGYRGLPGAIGYGASKAGLIHLAENLRADLKPPAYRVQVINPGFIETRLTEQNDFPMPFIMSPEDAADRVMKALASGRFRTGFPARFAMVFRLAALLPDWAYLPLLPKR